MGVSVVDHDPPSAGSIGLLGDRPGELDMLDLAADEDVLAGLDVDPDADDEPGVAIDQLHWAMVAVRLSGPLNARVGAPREPR